jgi:ATP-binding cassette, subfamily B, bacterial PglK
MSVYKKLNSLLTVNDKKSLILLVILSIVFALIETVGVAIIMPFISVSSDFSLIESNEYYKYIYDLFEFNSDVGFVIAFGLTLLIFYIFRGGFNIFYTYMLARFSKGKTHYLSFKLFESYLGLSYHQFINKNSSELSKTVINETQYLTILISSVLLIVSELLVVLFIYSAMLYVNYNITIIMTLFLGFNVLILVKTISKKIKKQGSVREKFQKHFFEIINSTFGNYKIIKLQTNDKLIMDKFSKASLGFSKSGIIHETLSSFPRIFLETIGFGLVALTVVYLIFTYETNISSDLGVLSMFVLGLYRLLPSSNRILTSYNKIMYYHKSLDLIHSDLMYDGEKLGEEQLNFNNSLTIQNVTFEYSEHKPIVENINLNILKGDKIAFIGPSGSGKSTLVDIITGLYRPNKGKIVVDNICIDESNVKALRKKVGYIPQNVYLFDGTVAENIAFGQEYNESKIKDVLQKSKILSFLELDQDGIETFVGEGGVRLSGGQKQRIAIARALYQEPEILVLDEATSALDENIEKEIMKEIYEISADKTLIIIAHRLSTIKNCNKIYKIENKQITIVKNE